jgi:hypothetical protein
VKRKYLTLPGLNSNVSVVQPVVSRCTGSAIQSLVYLTTLNDVDTFIGSDIHYNGRKINDASHPNY